MTPKELKAKLQNDPVARAKFIAHTVKYYHDVGIDLTPDDLHKFTDDALKKAVHGQPGAASNVYITIVGET